MKDLNAFIINSTPIVINLCKISLDITELYPGSRIRLPLTAHGAIHGHTDIGSFIISKRYDKFATRSWGMLVISTSQTENECIFDITLKK